MTDQQNQPPDIGEVLELAGTLTTITLHTTRQGRAWATATVKHADGSTDLLVYPNAFEAMGGHLVHGAATVVSIHPSGAVTALSMDGHRWAAPTPDELAAAEEQARREIRDHLNGLGMPVDSKPLSLGRIFARSATEG